MKNELFRKLKNLTDTKIRIVTGKTNMEAKTAINGIMKLLPKGIGHEQFIAQEILLQQGQNFATSIRIENAYKNKCLYKTII